MPVTMGCWTYSSRELQDGQRYIAAAAIENDTQVDIIKVQLLRV